jgi:hypothetical protein
VAVRIQQRGQVLNKRGEFTICKLTRMDLAVEWERKCCKHAWFKREGLEVDEEDGMACKVKEKRKRQEEVGSKRRKREEGAIVWGETVCECDKERNAFLQDQTGVREGTKQTQGVDGQGGDQGGCVGGSGGGNCVGLCQGWGGVKV